MKRDFEEMRHANNQKHMIEFKNLFYLLFIYYIFGKKISLVYKCIICKYKNGAKKN